ncbi:MAG: FAD:protein FMN transferase [Clostridiales Family XIII bacterium]|jgi:thiamine biosynthesis lipoprotein|nr:FAD:protein FMN transferase [Clostridiales Family XIII bacterium]
MNAMRKRLLAAALAVALAAATGACSPSAAPADGEPGRGEPFARTRADLLGTLVTISIYDGGLDDAALAAIADRCFLEAEAVEARMSANRADSELSALNRAAGGGFFEASGELFGVVARAVEISGMSGGAFDVSIGPVMELWKEDGAFARLPSERDTGLLLPLVGYKGIELRPPGGIRLAERGMALDLGGIAKGYACDRALAVLSGSGVKHAILDFGGNVYALGTRPDDSPWRVGIRVPLAGESGVVCSVEASDASVVTSGGYERFFERGGELYHHLLDPATGRPARSGLLSATVIAESSMDADALSTACFVLGPEKALRLLEESGREGVLIGEDFSIRATEGLAGAIRVTDGRFSLAPPDPLRP